MFKNKKNGFPAGIITEDIMCLNIVILKFLIITLLQTILLLYTLYNLYNYTRTSIFQLCYAVMTKISWL